MNPYWCKETRDIKENKKCVASMRETILMILVITGILAVVNLVAGCATPKNTYSFKITDPTSGAVKEGRITAPKNAVVEGLEITRPDGTRVKLKRMESKNDPEVIKAQGKREKENTDATARAAGIAAEAALKAAITAGS